MNTDSAKLAVRGQLATPLGARQAARPYLEQAGRLRQTGRLAESIAPLQQAIRLDPGNAAAHHDLGVTLINCNRLAEAAASLRHAAELKPDFAHAHLMLGIAAQGLGQDDLAIAAFRRAATLSRKLTAAHDNLGNLMLSRGEKAEAAQCYRRAAAGARGTTLGRLSEAKAFMADNDPAAAEKRLRQALALDPKCDEAHRLLGQVLAEAGRFQEASAHFEQAIALSPHPQEVSWLGLVGCKKLTEADRPFIARMIATLETRALAAPQQVKLHFALGKALDDCGDYAEAMRHFNAGNRLRGGFGKFDRSRLQSLVDRLIARCTPDYFARHASIGADDETPLLIVGMPRSGTTLVEQIVSSHSRIGGGGELLFWGTHGPAWYQDAAAEATAKRAPQLATDYRAVLHRLAAGAARVTDKMPFNFLWLGLALVVFPRARVIHCRRNPIDTCLSIYLQHYASLPDYASDRSDLVFCYRQYQRLMKHWREVLRGDRFLEVDYEELVADSETGARQLIGFCGLEWEDACLCPERNERRILTASSWQARQPIYRTSVERWRRYEPWLGELRELLPQPEDAL
jgi:tetratricopeptide (TPR) repeat protein